MDDPIFKQKYQKYKLRVKFWEKDFKRIHSRIPSKHDIREAPQQIRDAYKMYYRLKTSFLEDTLNDVLAEDGFDMLDISQTESEFAGSETARDGEGAVNLSGIPQLPLDIVSIVQSGTATATTTQEPPVNPITNVCKEQVNKEFEAVQTLESNIKAWGSAVSKIASKGDNEEIKGSGGAKGSLVKSLSQKLFKSTSFSKRNPRKSLSRNNSEVGGRTATITSTASEPFDTTAPQHEVLPDLETILVQKAKEQQTLASINMNPLLETNKTKEAITTHVDEKWLQRTAAQDGIKLKIACQRVDSTNSSLTDISRKPSYGLSNIDVTKLVQHEETTKLENKPHTELLEINDSPTVPLVNRHLKDIKASGGDSDSIVSDSGDEDTDKSYRHRAKRRKVLTTVNRNEQLNFETTESTIKQTEEISAIEMNQDDADGKDFSADEERDADYVPPTKAKTKSKRAKKVKEVKESSNMLKNVNKKTTRVKNADNSKRKNVKATIKVNDPGSKLEIDQEQIEEKPPEQADLKYALLLECGDITSVPRIDMQELNTADNVVQRYILAARSNVPKSVTNGQVNEKRAAARKLLEAKIATGKLNENYVRIDIQKKKFSRGKKNVNYSRYKKQQWKHKKRVAALTGPDMDMGGCDGGVLKCFTCGQVGHFASNCKVKGDSLLPLTAQLEEDPSPFPTLEEAERMAAESALAVHSRNIDKLPAATNSALYDSTDNETNDSEGGERNTMSEHEDENEIDKVEECFIETDDELENIDLNAATQISPIKPYVGHQIPEDFLKQAGLDGHQVPQVADAGGALYDLDSNGEIKEPTAEVYEALHMFGHTSFRKGQERAIMRILSGLSTLVTLSTGSGKSLCYQLPAYLYSRRKKSITLVISPLVSLMEDQVTGVPHFLRAHCLHTNQTPQQRLKVLDMIKAGEVDILLVSPEAVVAGERSTGFGSILRQLPPIAFACIDEAHCVSQWSHNFRPSYLMICKVLRKNLGVNTVLGLTATATLPTRLSIIDHLGIADGERGIISDTPLPDNLVLSVSKDENKDAGLMLLLSSTRFSDCQSIIVYCTRRDECERVATYLRTCLQDDTFANAAPRKRKRMNWAAEPYHAGMPSSRRRTIQNAFMRNELRIVVATIAFGMGINKPDIRAVIHYNMPRNFESYVQEIGRAGRDGKLAHCHLFLDARGNDLFELRRHIYANSIDRHVIRKLLQHIFVPCACEKNVNKGALINQEGKERAGERICPGHEIGFSIQQTVEALDIPEENISTLLCYLELDRNWRINMLSSAYTRAKVISYGGAKYLKHAAKECAPLAMAIALEIKKGTFKEDANIIEFSVVEIAAAIGWNSGVVKYQLKNLEWVQVDGYPKRSPINVNFYELGFRLKAPGDFTIEEIDDTLDTLYNRSVKQEKTQLIQLQYVFQGLSSVAYNTCTPCTSDNFPLTRSDQLKGIIRDYFQNDYPKDMKLEDISDGAVDDAYIENDVHAITNMYPDNNFSGRSIARIFHGISSPNYPAVMWGRCKFWRAHCKVDFNRLVQLANAIIVKRRT